MSNPTLYGYLERPYLSDDYLSEVALMGYGMQASLTIVNKTDAIGAQAKLAIAATGTFGEQVKGQIANFPHATGTQTQGAITDFPHATGMQTLVNPGVTDTFGAQISGTIVAKAATGEQVKGQIVNALSPFGMQVKGVIATAPATGSQTTAVILGSAAYGIQVKGLQSKQAAYGMQAKGDIVSALKALATEIRHDNFSTWCVGGYLETPYLVDPYLTCIEGGQFVAQMKGFIVNRPAPYGMQVKGLVEAKKALGMQVKGIIDAKTAYGMQVHNFGRAVFGMQTTFVLYNTTNLRIMATFPSRGLDGLTWTANSTAPGDFGANLLNSDILEQQWRSNGTVTGITLTCDTQVTAVFVDTVAILNHNLTTSAVVVMEGSNDPAFGTIGTSFSITILRNIANAYYIAPFLPLAGYRYWRLQIDDPTNTQGQIRIGTIVFGPSIIFQGDNITDHVVRYMTHFADKIPTEGFTDVMNDRALKYGVKLEFKNLVYSKGNYQQLDQVFQLVRTSLKALWVPDPRAPERFAVFAKMKEIPESTHNVLSVNDADYVDLNIDLDESL